MIQDARQVFDRNTRILAERVQQREIFVNRVKASTDTARSLMENGNDEEIVRSYQSVINCQIEENFDDDELSHFDSSDTFKPILAGVIKELVEDKAEVGNSKAARKKEQWYSSEEGKLRLELLKVYFQQSGIEYETSMKAFT